MSQYAGAKNPPWARGGNPGSVGGSLSSSLLSASHNAAAASNLAVVAAQNQQANQQGPGSFGTSLTALGLQVLRQESALSFGQKNSMPPSGVLSQGPILHVSQPGIALPTTLSTTQVASVSYPSPRLIGQPGIQFQPSHHPNAHQVHQAVAASNQQQQAQQPKPRVFTGTITKLLDNFGFVDEDVFFQTSAIQGSMPKVLERVLVEASYNPNMPFKWNATRIQVLPNQLNSSLANRVAMSVSCNIPTSSMSASVVSSAGLPVMAVSSASVAAQFANPSPRMIMVPTRRHSPPPVVIRREVRREDRRDRYRDREYERYSPTPVKRPRSPKRLSRSPPRRRQRIVPRYNVQIPKISLDLRDGNIVELRNRYTNLYIPSDFFSAGFLWQDAFPPHRPFGLENPCSFHIMPKEVDNVVINDAVLEPPDVDHMFSAKVMLLCTPPVEEIYQKACALAEDQEEKKEAFVHPTRLVSFLVGLKGKNETVAIGGPWSPSLDGPNPDGDPGVLIKTAIRTCKALTGIDLSPCTHWYRFAEIHYRRGESTNKCRVSSKRVETVVIFLPDIWSCIPTRLEWDQLALNYKNQLQQKEEQAEEMQAEDEDQIVEETPKREPSHHSELDPKSMKVSDLRGELEARGINIRGLKSQLIARLSKTLKLEYEKDGPKEKASKVEDVVDLESEAMDDEKKKKEEEDKKLKDEKDRVALEKKYQLPETPAVIVHPSIVAKGGKFDCTIMSLSVLLDYRQEDNKEHSFEVSLFAELFNEMLMRDFGFQIYKAMVEAPDLKEEEKDKKKSEKKDDRKDNKKDDKDERNKKKETEDDYSDYDETGDDEDIEEDKNKSNEKKRKAKEKKNEMCTVDPLLLLSFVYFDQNHCGYILEKDLEEMLYIIGLHLSRSQVRKLLQKVVRRESLHYRRLTDKPLSTDQDAKNEGSLKKKPVLEELGAGNKKYLPNFKMPIQDINSSSFSNVASTNENGNGQDSTNLCEIKKEILTSNGTVQACRTNEPLVVYKGALLDVEKLMQQLKRSEKARADTEEKMREMQEELDEMHEAASISEQNAQKLSVELEDCCQRLKTIEEDHRVAQIQVDKYQRALAMCRDQLHLLLGSVENSLEGAPTTFLTNSRKPLTYAIVTKSERTDTHTQDAD